MKIALLILLTHFVADFLLQNDDMALNKSKSNYWLSIHVLVYSTTFLFLWTLFSPENALGIWIWVLINYMLHWLTDYCTSRLTSYLWQKEQRHWFFVAIGFDQLVHYTCLLLTYEWLFL